jgi:hypothetical protein
MVMMPSFLVNIERMYSVVDCAGSGKRRALIAELAIDFALSAEI